MDECFVLCFGYRIIPGKGFYKCWVPGCPKMKLLSKYCCFKQLHQEGLMACYHKRDALGRKSLLFKEFSKHIGLDGILKKYQGWFAVSGDGNRGKWIDWFLAGRFLAGNLWKVLFVRVQYSLQVLLIVGSFVPAFRTTVCMYYKIKKYRAPLRGT